MNNNKISRFIILLIATFSSILAFGQNYYPGKYAGVVDMRTYVDENFTVYYSVCIENKTDKVITSVKYDLAFRDPYKEINSGTIENWEITSQVTVPSGEKKFTRFIDVMPNHTNYVMYGIYLSAVRFSDGTMLQRGSNYELGDYSPF